ncbi:MAG: glycoside hydrolase/phage tail family protein, partial [Rhodobacterales bacterium]|nr:glycoside hydrolase/phage tail family protein [Rhodobacterales bacterium]
QVLGLSGAVIGRAVGATLGRVIDQRILGAGSSAVEVGRVESFRLMGAGEGAAIPRAWGRVRLAGHVIWASRFLEQKRKSGGGKGAPRPKTVEYSYSVSLALALCEGPITAVGRIWADGMEMSTEGLALRVYPGTEEQLPDPRIEAIEGAGLAPAYRGLAYVVIEDLDLGRFGNRVPQLSLEVMRGVPEDLRTAVRAVALVPGTGEYALATRPVTRASGTGATQPVNVNTLQGVPDLTVSLAQLREELPQAGSVGLVVSWFGTDLRCGDCRVLPRVETADPVSGPVDWAALGLPQAGGGADGYGFSRPWRVSGLGRDQAGLVPRLEGRPVYGGTPEDAGVIEAIRAIRDGGQEVMFYPFVLMEQLAGNGLPDPWTGAPEQPALPWRGRITLSVAPGRAGSPDRTAAAEAEVAAFFGAAQPGDFTVSDGEVIYSGPEDGGYRRFILHYAHLCALAGGVDAFCIGSELRGLTQIRGAGDSFPAVAALRQLAAEVRAILGPATAISYAADWSEYFGYHDGQGNVQFHLDPLWADPHIDFVGIDNYMPLSDWRDGEDHADAGWGSIYNLDYLKANIAGGEGFDWYYDSPEGEAAQRRVPITDGSYGEPWVFRFKDLKSWWGREHHDRVNGLRSPTPTAWQPGMKPIRFTEYGCGAIDKGTNHPNRFLDPKSSESLLPRASTGRRDDLIQLQYLRAMAGFWADPGNNPVSPVYGGPMVDMARAHAWAWDARPFPAFPQQADLWADADNYARGHWLNGRATNLPLAPVAAEICAAAGVGAVETSGLHGLVRGYAVDAIGSARAALQPLMLGLGFEAVERDGAVRLATRTGRLAAALDPETLMRDPEAEGTVELVRAPEAETAGRVRVGYYQAEGDFALRTAEAVFPDDATPAVSQTDLPLTLTAAEARGIAERWLAESRVARDRARLALPPSALGLGAGDVVALEGSRWRIDRVELAEGQRIEAVRIEPAVYVPSDAVEERVIPAPFTPPVPVLPLFLDLPLLTGTEEPHVPHLAVTAQPWPGQVALWSSDQDAGYQVNTLFGVPAVVGFTETPLARAPSALWDRGPALRVRLVAGSLAAADMAQVLNGANAAAIGSGASDAWEVIQFAEAEMVAPQTWDLRLRLRGLAGSDATAPAEWPTGSLFVLLDGGPVQISLASSARGLARYYRVGPAARGPDDPVVVQRVEAFRGIGLRPLSPVHLRAETVAGDLRLTWIRRGRIDADSWEAMDIPLGEEREAYLIRLRDPDGAVLREVQVTTPAWTYAAPDRAADAAPVGSWVEVAQISDRFGPGPFARLDLPA